VLIPIEEHELLVFWVQLFVIVVFARSLGWLMRRIGLPGVIGELGAGLVLGPSIFGVVWPEGFRWFLPEEHAEVTSAALLAVGWVGVVLLLVVTGFETDLGLIQKLGALALSVSSLAVVAKILSELGLMRRDFGQITVAAGMANVRRR